MVEVGDPILLIMKLLRKTLPYQIKSKWYYVFWGSMAVAVVGGQIYVGLGYRQMAEATKSTMISVTCVTDVPLASDYSTSRIRNRTGEFE